MYYAWAYLREDPEFVKEYVGAGLNSATWEWAGREIYPHYLREMKPYGLNLFIGIDNEYHLYQMLANENPSLEEQARQVFDIVSTIGSTKPENLICYILQDEPWPNGVTRVTQWHHAARRADPHHPTAVTLHQDAFFNIYKNASDIIMTDPYPGFPGGNIEKVANYLIAARRATGGRKPIIAVLQAFGEPSWDVNAVLPTPEELRCMTYLSIVHLARGVIYFSYDYNHPMKEHHQPQWQEIKNLAGEMRDLGEVLLADSGQLKLRRVSSKDVHVRVIQHDGDVYILAVNVKREPRRGVRIEVEGLEKTVFQPLLPAGDDRSYRYDRELVLDFAPLEVRLFKSQK